MYKKIINDFVAGIAVFLVAIPLCLGIAIASGAPLMSGLIAGIIGGIVVGLLSKSPLSVSGPAAGLVAIVVTSVHKIGFEGFLLALVLGGCIQIILGLCKASKVAKFIPVSVIKGMLAAIGMTLIIKQLPTMLGIDLNHFQWDMNSIAINVLIIGIVSLAILITWKKWFAKRFPTIPGSLIAVIIGVGISLLYNAVYTDWHLIASQLVSLPTNIHGFSSLRSSLQHPSFVERNNSQIYITAITIALVATIESILCIQAIDKLDPLHRQTPLNRELIAQGTGNIISGLIGGLPITSVIVRSSVNLHAGAKSKASAIFHGVFILLALMFAAHYIDMIPMAVLSAILVFTGYQLTSPEKFINKYKKGYSEFIPFVATFIIILLQDLLIGVLCGIVIYYIILSIQKKRIPHKEMLDENVD